MIGFIGCGNMGSAMMRGILEAGKCGPQDIIVSARHPQKAEALQKELGVRAAKDNCEAAGCADILFLAVKPQQYESVIREIAGVVRGEQIVVSIAPGKTLQWLAQQFGKPVKLVRMMPNTPATVKEGMTGVCAGEHVTPEELEKVCGLCGGFSRTEVVPEHLMEVVTGVSGSSPAYVFLFIEAMADAAVAEGMPRAQAYRFAAQAVLGSAKMVLDTGLHPGELKDMVCSPGGTTIEAVGVLEGKGLRGAVYEAVRACVRKSRGI